MDDFGWFFVRVWLLVGGLVLVGFSRVSLFLFYMVFVFERVIRVFLRGIFGVLVSKKRGRF